MEGYDVTLLSSFYGYPAFREAYGAWLDDEHGYQINADWQRKFNMLGALGNIVGALLNGWATARWGHRKVLITSLTILTGFIFIVFFAPNIETQLAGQVLCNVPWGVSFSPCTSPDLEKLMTDASPRSSRPPRPPTPPRSPPSPSVPT